MINTDEVRQKTVMETFAEVLQNKETTLATIPGAINALKALFPDVQLIADLSPEDLRKIQEGVLEFVKGQDGKGVLAALRDPKTKQIIKQVRLKEANLSPDMMSSLTLLAIQTQLSKISQQIGQLCEQVEEVRQGLQNDRLAEALACVDQWQKCMLFEKPSRREQLLVDIIRDIDKARNKLKKSHDLTLAKILKVKPRSLFSHGSVKELDKWQSELYEGFIIITVLSQIQVMAYQQLGELRPIDESLRWYNDFLRKSYPSDSNVVKRLDSLSVSIECPWSKAIGAVRQIPQLLDYSTPAVALLEDSPTKEV